MTLADTLVVMNKGYVEQIGKPLEIYHKPASQFVASFIGSPEMNFMEVKISDDKSGIEIDDKKILPLSSELLEQYEHRQLVMGIRPEALRIADAEDSHQFQMRVDLVEALGSDTIAYGHLDGSKRPLVVKLSGHIRTHVGEVLTLSVRPANLHFFDKVTGKRIIGF